MRACLPDRLWEAFQATSGPGGAFGFLTEQLNELVVVEESIMYPGGSADPAEDHYAVDRRTLRRLLLAGLDDEVHFDAEFVCYEYTDDGQVVAVFADGRHVVGDVLVGADGASSRVCGQYLRMPNPLMPGSVGSVTSCTSPTRPGPGCPNGCRSG
ncbi:MAG: FAD-dependent oxidoreductase [Pseudonocardiaceae bacterium]